MIPSAKKLLLAGNAAKPFTLSGSFETGNDGWTLSNFARGDASRTGSFAVTSQSGGGSITYTLLRAAASGLKITLTAYIRRRSASNNRIDFLVDGAVRQTIPLTTDSTAWLQWSGSFRCPTAKGCQVRIVCSGVASDIDDWMIRGTRT